ncbi:MAG: hypothetical protein PHW24_03050 [Candidatus Moranbacteria bacterium]|nr:hypothetical protein [Candidatus Moranbacteria bacterium]
MRAAFEAASKAYETVKKSVQEKWEGFKKKFEGTKTEASQEAMNARTPDDLIALGKKLQAQGEALKAEEESVKIEEAGEDEKHQAEEMEMKGAAEDEAIKMNKEFDANKAAEEEAKRKAEIAEQYRIAAEQEASKLAEIRAKISGKEERDEILGTALSRAIHVGERKKAEEQGVEKTEFEKIVEQSRKFNELSDGEKAELREKIAGLNGGEKAEPQQIDAVALNNKIVNIRGEKARTEAIANLSEEEISAVAKNIASSDWEHTLSFLNNFQNKAEIVSSPEMTNKFKEMLSSGRIHLYDVDRIQGLPGISKDIFSDAAVKKGVKNSIKSFVSYQNGKEWPHVSDSINRVVEGTGMETQDIRDIAEEIKTNSDVFGLFVQQFGVKRLYPEVG